MTVSPCSSGNQPGHHAGPHAIGRGMSTAARHRPRNRHRVVVGNAISARPVSPSPQAWSARPCSSASPFTEALALSVSSSAFIISVRRPMRESRNAKCCGRDRARGGAVLIVPSTASAQESHGPTEEHKFADHAAEECATCSKRARTVTPAKRRRARSCTGRTKSLGLDLVRGAAVPAVQVRLAGLKAGLAARDDRIRADSSAETAKGEADQILSDYKAQLADARNESARIIEEARQAGDALRRDQDQRLQNELAELGTSRYRTSSRPSVKRIGDLRDEVASWPSVQPRSSSNATSIQTRRCDSSRATSNGHEPEQLMVAISEDRIEATRRDVRGRARRRHDRRGRGRALSCARALEGSDELREALSDHKSLPAGSANRRRPARVTGDARDLALVSMVVGHRRGRDLPTIIDALVRKSAESHNRAVAAVRSTVELSEQKRIGWRNDREGDGKKVEVKVISTRRSRGVVTTIGDTVIDVPSHRLEH